MATIVSPLKPHEPDTSGSALSSPLPDFANIRFEGKVVYTDAEFQDLVAQDLLQVPDFCLIRAQIPGSQIVITDPVMLQRGFSVSDNRIASNMRYIGAYPAIQQGLTPNPVILAFAEFFTSPEHIIRSYRLLQFDFSPQLPYVERVFFAQLGLRKTRDTDLVPQYMFDFVPDYGGKLYGTFTVYGDSKQIVEMTQGTLARPSGMIDLLRSNFLIMGNVEAVRSESTVTDIYDHVLSLTNTNNTDRGRFNRLDVMAALRSIIS